ncbi:MAG TPA: response regulator [Sphingomonas sp.]|nr:response regulator [Sphingomonas sp.]
MPADQSSSSAIGAPWNRIARPLRLACIVLPALLFGGLAWVDYWLELQRTRVDVITSVNAVAEHARTVMETANLVISRVLNHIDQQTWPALATTRETHEFLDQLRQELPQIEAVYLIDPNGVIVASTRAYPMPRYDVHTASYFVDAMAANADASVISPPFADTKSHTTGFMISRARMHDGRFDGVVGVTVSRRYFENFYNAILDRPDASVAGLFSTDGAVLVRFPASPEYIAQLPPTNGMLQAVRSGATAGLISGPSSEDGTPRISAFRKLDDLPVLAGYGIDRSVLLTTWGTHAGVMVFCAVLLSALLLVALTLVRRHSEIEHASLRQLVDETERRLQVEARAQEGQKMEALGRLTGGVAHDFNNLLAVILGSLELVLRRESDTRKIRLLTAATEAAKRGANLTAQMLAFSRKQETTVAPVDVNTVIRTMEELLLRTLGPEIQLRYDLAADLWPALADVTQLEMAILNLAVNARDAMPEGGQLSFRTCNTSSSHQEIPSLAAGDYVCAVVCDTGEGMSEEVRARALEPFFTTKEPGGGTGLGLSMVAGFLNDVGGGLTIDSVQGRGTIISLYLPKSTIAPGVAPPSQPSTVAGGRHRILLVDDDDGVRLSVRATLEDLGHTVMEASGGPAALELLAHDRNFNLLILDFAMPMMNGAQLAARITANWPDAPILFVTGYVENDGLRRWSERGYRTLRKPFSSRELAEAIGRAARQLESAGS